MKLAMILLCCAPGFAFAESWTGALVNSKCYDNEVSNTNPSNTDAAVNTDKDAEIRYCHPNAKTKSFAVVDFDGSIHKLDAEGNTKAEGFVRANPQKSRYRVEVTGEKNRDVIKVESIRLAANP
jgi:hypothetical protein